MRRLTILTAALLSSSMFAATVAGDTLSESGLCRHLESRLEQCNSEGRLSSETRASCDRIEQGFRATCGRRGTIYASASADSAALDLLNEDYEVVPIEGTVLPEHVVIGPDDLDDPGVIALLRRAHEGGRTVAITAATEEEARTFHRLIRLGQELDCAAPGPRGGEISLYGLQRSLNPAQEASYCLQDLDERNPAADRQWLRGRFAPMPPSRVRSVGLTDDPDQQLTTLAGAQSCYYKSVGPIDGVGNISWVIDVWSMRNFKNEGFCKPNCTADNEGADYYLVNFNPSLTPEVKNVRIYDVAARRLTDEKSGKNLNTDFIELTNTDPGNLKSVTTYTNSKSSTVGGSVAVGLTPKGPTINVTAGGSVTVSHSTMTTIPEVTIDNQSDTVTAEPGWKLTPRSTTIGDTYSPKTAWLWIVGREAYPSGGTGVGGQVSFDAGANIFTETTNTDVFVPCNISYPFTAWKVSEPQLSMLDPTSVSKNGGIFLIHGQFLYPSSVTSVLVGGVPQPLSTNITLKSNTEIKVVLDPASGVPRGVDDVVVGTQFNDTNRFSNVKNLTVTD